MADDDRGSATQPQKSATRANPLSKFASYNYVLTFYMISPEALNLYYTQQSTSNLVPTAPNGFYIIAQSGGIQTNGANPRAPGFDLDFHIDDLTFKSFVSTSATGTSQPIGLNFKFKIYEPYGVSFPTKLTELAAHIQRVSNLPGFGSQSRALDQHYAIGVKFIGYDTAGKLLTSLGDNAERIYPVTLLSMKFKLDGKMVSYDIDAEPTNQRVSMGVKRGIITSAITVAGSTVGDALASGTTSFIKQINNIESAKQAERQKQAAGKKTFANTYAIKFNGTEISSSKLINSAEKASFKQHTMPSTLTKSIESNDRASGRAKTVDSGVRGTSFAAGTHMLNAIEQIIAQSSYIRDALSKVETSTLESSKRPTLKTDSSKTFKWMSITTTVNIIGFDEVLSDYAYGITFNVQPYQTPYIRSPMVPNPPKYNGPFKKYDYWFTGKNSEIISYEQTFNNLYFVAGIDASSTNQIAANSPKADIPSVGNRTGEQKTAADAVNNVRTSLQSPSDMFSARLSILGDPDYLIRNLGDRASTVFSTEPDTAIAPAAAPVFIEVFFNQGVDYSHKTGTMTLDSNLRFFSYPKKTDTKGMVFIVNDVTSTFSHGRFSQDFNMVWTSLEQFSDSESEPVANTQPTLSITQSATDSDMEKDS